MYFERREDADRERLSIWYSKGAYVISNSYIQGWPHVLGARNPWHTVTILPVGTACTLWIFGQKLVQPTVLPFRCCILGCHTWL